MVIAERTIRAAIVKPTNKAAIVNVVCVMDSGTSPLRPSNLAGVRRRAANRRQAKAYSEEVDGGRLVAVFRMRGRVRLRRPVDDRRARRGDPLPAAGRLGLRSGARGGTRASQPERVPAA